MQCAITILQTVAEPMALHRSWLADFGGIRTAPTNLVSSRRKLNVAVAFAYLKEKQNNVK